MADRLLALSLLLWIAVAILAMSGRWMAFGRALLTAGALSGIIAALIALPGATDMVALPIRLAGEPVAFRMQPEALWLFGFGLAPAVFACALGSPSRHAGGGWNFGAALSLLGALGVCGLQNGAALLVAWEAMSLGGAIMILSEGLESSRGATILFMLALLEVGAVALVLAVAILGLGSSSLDFARFAGASAALTPPMQIGVGASDTDRLRRQARTAAVLRMVPGRVWLRQRRFGRDPFWSRFERGVFRACRAA